MGLYQELYSLVGERCALCRNFTPEAFTGLPADQRKQIAEEIAAGTQAEGKELEKILLFFGGYGKCRAPFPGKEPDELMELDEGKLAKNNCDVRHPETQVTLFSLRLEGE